MSKQHMTAEEVAAAYNALNDENKELRKALESARLAVLLLVGQSSRDADKELGANTVSYIDATLAKHKGQS